MRIHRVASILGVFAIAVGSVRAGAPGRPPMTRQEFGAKLGYKTGKVTLLDGAATIDLPESFRYLDAEGSRRLLVEGWGNPPESATGVLGMLVPSSVSPLDPAGWGIVITFDEEGYV